EEAKFQRQQGEWLYPSVEQKLSLETLLQNLRTFAIKEEGKDVYLIPQSQSEFKHLLSLLYDHPASEFAADALWQKFIGSEKTLPENEATHIGPSVAMLLRLDLRYRSQQHNSMIFRAPEFADAHEQAMKSYEQSWAHQANSGHNTIRLRTRLTGLFRLLDKNWQYKETSYPNKDNLTIQMPPKAQGPGQKGGLLFCDGLKLHPNNQAWFAWVSSKEELTQLHTLVTSLRGSAGRIPVMAFTSSIGVNDHYVKGGVSEALKDDILLYHLNTTELDVLERIGLLSEFCQGFELKNEVFTTKFKNRLNGLRDYAYTAINHWRHRLQERGLIAWPLRPTGKLNTQDREKLFQAWRLFMIDEPTLGGLHGLMPEHGLDASELAGLFSRLVIGSKMQAQSYEHNEHAGLFIDLEQPTHSQARFPVFLAKISNPSKAKSWTLAKAKQEWYWGYIWSGGGLNTKSIFDDWMWWCSSLHLLKIEDVNVKTPRWIPVPRAELGNAIVEASNWFHGTLYGKKDEGYPATVEILEKVYGYDRIPGLFAPNGKSPEGTETVEANDQLIKAKELFTTLKNQEENLGDSLSGNESSTDNESSTSREFSIDKKFSSEILEALPTILRNRQKILSLLDKVYPKDKPDIQIGNINMIHWEDRRVSLYERVERARLFAEYVRHCGDRICERVKQLQQDITSDPEAQLPFPQRLFTLSMETVSNIFEGALNQGGLGNTQQLEASGTSDTLLHYLRSLQLDRASERLDLLGREVGYDPQTQVTKQFNEISGFIISTFRRFKTRYSEVVKQYEDIEKRISSMILALDALPVDYPEPDQLQVVLKLQSRLQLIGDSFEELDEKVDEERQKFTRQARKGKFSAINDTQERLLNPIQQQLGVAGGALLKIENAVESYRDQQLATLNSDLRPLIEPLFLACHEAIPAPLQLSDVRDLSLHDMHVSIDIQQQQWEKKSEELLSD
ncbi:MAG: hypothetical protein KAI17_14070, partial [Thiotrichaceae bacterium]|nr:hypothetical protein [Thiotrichaceae bacterium]